MGKINVKYKYISDGPQGASEALQEIYEISGK